MNYYRHKTNFEFPESLYLIVIHLPGQSLPDHLKNKILSGFWKTAIGDNQIGLGKAEMKGPSSSPETNGCQTKRKP
jgi:hypothetical protein